MERDNAILQVDCSKSLLAWANAEGYAVLDVNVFPKPYAKSKVRSSTSTFGISNDHAPLQLKHTEDYGGAVLVYLWDNYVQYVCAHEYWAWADSYLC